MEEERVFSLLQEIAKWNIEEKLQQGQKPKVVFEKKSYRQISTIEYLKFRKLKLNEKDLVFSLKFYFRFSFFKDNFQPYDPTVNPYITGEVFLSASSLNILGFDFEIKDLRPWHSNFIGMSYLPLYNRSKLNGKDFFNQCILRQESFEEKFKKTFVVV